MKFVLSRNLSPLVCFGLLLGSMVLALSTGQGLTTAQPLSSGRQVVTLAPPMDALQAVQQLALDLANRDRATEGLPPMQVDARLSQAAQSHAMDMLRRNYFDHYSPEGRSPSDRLAAVGGTGFPAENIVMGQHPRIRGINIQVLEHFQRRWMRSPDHRRHLMNPHYAKFGYGLALDPSSGRTLAVQLFTRP